MPSLLVLVVYCTPVTSLATTTSASTMTPLAGSWTEPFIFPLGDWAKLEWINSRPQTSTRTQPERRISYSPVISGFSGTHRLIHGTMLWRYHLGCELKRKRHIERNRLMFASLVRTSIARTVMITNLIIPYATALCATRHEGATSGSRLRTNSAR